MKNMWFDSVRLLRVPPMKILVIFSNDLHSLFGKTVLFSFYIDIAWDIITEFAAEKLELEQVDILEKEKTDELTEILDRKRKETLAQKRSFFVRMVSDPKIYNPAINKAGTPRMSTEQYSPITEGAPSIQTPTSR